MTIEQWIQKASAQLKVAGIATHRLDAELLLADSLGRDRVYLHAHNDDELTTAARFIAEEHLGQRAQRAPLAYVVGTKEFYGHTFTVTPDVLIPRPETETLVECVLGLPLKNGDTILDVGTGSGAIAISLKLARPDLRVDATDTSIEALAIARKNAIDLATDIHFSQSNLLQHIPISQPTCIVANLPYVDPTWTRSPETDYEPALALFGGREGLALIQELIDQAKTVQTSGGYLALEADPTQHGAIVAHANAAGYRELRRRDYALILQRD
jgi:release factor glutamine methyltransferase